MSKNYKYLKALTWQARNNPSIWVEDPENINYIDWSHPSKNRLNAYQLEGSNKIIYLDDKTYKDYVNYDWRIEIEDRRFHQNMVSLDYLHDEYELDVSEDGYIITKDNYYLYSDKRYEIDEAEAQAYLFNKVNEFIQTLNAKDKEVLNLLYKGFKTREIADSMGVCQTSIMKRINKIKNSFKKFKK